MTNINEYYGGLTAEQFLFYEIRIVAKYFLEGKGIDEIIEFVQRDNLFQYPTKPEVSRFARACHKRLVALDNANTTIRKPTEARTARCLLTVSLRMLRKWRWHVARLMKRKRYNE